jgi:hypoxanthine phosphoribosyltransferase
MAEEEVSVVLAKYYKSDFKQLSWNEYGKILEDLYEKVSSYVKERKIKIDAVVTILRGGAFPGGFLAHRLHLLRILPIQYKYFFVKGKIKLKKLLDVPKTNLPKKPTFLLVENNHCFGLTATTAAKYLKQKFPGCKIIYAADTMDYSFAKNEFADVLFYGRYTNDTKKLPKGKAKKLGIDTKMWLYPWENLKEEWTTVQGKQFKYKDLGEKI